MGESVNRETTIARGSMAVAGDVRFQNFVNYARDTHLMQRNRGIDCERCDLYLSLLNSEMKWKTIEERLRYLISQPRQVEARLLS